jgi:antitoxin (DNA-binding transcriptional repressor) of toxin-antitoxin stability system
VKAKPTAIVGTVEAKAKLSTLLERVARGEHIVITRHGKPIARLNADCDSPGGQGIGGYGEAARRHEAWRPIVEGIARRGSQVTEATKVIDTPIDSEGDIASAPGPTRCCWRAPSG